MEEAAGQRILIVGGGPFQLELIRAARASRLHVLVADGRAEAPGLRFAHTPLVIDTRDAASMVRAARAHRVHGVATAASDAALNAVAAVAEALSLPGLDTQIMQRGRDKLSTFECLKAHGLRAPITIPVSNAVQAAELLSRVGGFPCVIKPRSSAGGRGVSIVTSIEELAPAIERAHRAAFDTSGALLQAHVAGRSAGVEAFFHEGEPVRAFIMNDDYEAGFVSPAGHSIPSLLEDSAQALLLEHVVAWGRALGFREGPINFDLRIQRGQVQLIEANMRLGGNSISELMHAGLGVDLSRATLCCALGRSPLRYLESEPPYIAVASRLILKRGVGQVVLAPELSLYRADPRVLMIDVPRFGETPVTVNGWSLLGRVIVRAESSRAASELAEEIADDVAAQTAFRSEPLLRSVAPV